MPLPPFLLGVALDGAGWHPAAWRSPDARPAELFAPRYWVDLVAEAERAELDFVTVDDSLGIQSARWRHADTHIDQVRGRLDAVLIASRVAPTTSRIGIIPTATTTHTEPFHISKAIATLDWVSGGRAGVQVRVSTTAVEAAQFGRRPAASDPAAVVDIFDEAADFVEVMRRLWDSWEDDAEIRDAATGRFVDRDRLHYIDFEGRWFSVKGPAITPRPPQGQPVVAALAHSTVPYRLAARQADIVFITPHDADEARAIEAELRREEAAAGRGDGRRAPAPGDRERPPGTRPPVTASDRRHRPPGRRDRAGRRRREPCGSAPTWWSSSTTSLARPPPAWRTSTGWPGGPTAPTPRCSPAPPPSWPTAWRRSGRHSPWMVTGSGPGRSPTTSR